MPKRRTLPYILLGLIHSNQQMTGYQMMQEFKHEISDFWTASHSQIYPELQRMADDGWIRPLALGKKVASKRNQTYYQVTTTGEQVLTEWLETPLTANDDELFPLKLFFIDDQNSKLLPPLISRQLELSTERRNYLRHRMTTVFPNQTAIQAHYGHYLTLSRGIERESNYVSWLKKLDAEMKR
ncbi:PadR family transcriptional regulator [Secundilactobacillus folii]|uniref:PadR family transcriptional regulator n=1 Tax=Secundilactobacillus folii TaxID=2678357 RepID=A0A7X3C2U5_9LACO|nr:PadR family transcriptional regulator [Secundilactobacillus folii]MTV81599.1 PadR family transcriptional regulator [Secundilactobacillus folii]